MSVSRADIFMATLGVEAYRVGGSVRDELLGKAPKDADYMVRGVSLFDLGRMLATTLAEGGYPKPSCKPLVLRDGRQAGWRVSARGLGCIEIVLPRTERPREARPGENVHRAFDIVVDPDLTLAEDAVRRDFTFNALYMRVEHVGVAIDKQVLDPTGRGLYDLQHKLVATTHESSFRDDPLRTLRALRFVATLGYDLATDTTAQMARYASAVTGLSAKGYASGTVYEELSRMLMGADAVKALRLARDTGVLAVVLPELAPMLGFDQGSRYHDLTTDEHTFTALETAVKVDAPLRVRWALLFHDSGKPACAWTGTDGRKHYYAYRGPDPDATPDQRLDHEVVGERIWRAAADRLSIPRVMREDVAKLVRNHMVSYDVKNVEVRVRRARVKFGDELLRDLLMHRMCDLSGKGGASVNRASMDKVAKMELARQRAQRDKVPASTGDLAINGHDCMAAGVEGRKIGAVLAQILDEVVCDPSQQKRSRDWQLGRITAHKGGSR